MITAQLALWRKTSCCCFEAEVRALQDIYLHLKLGLTMTHYYTNK